MKEQIELKVVSLAKKCARLSLLLGISIFLAFAIFKAAKLMIVGAIFLIVAFIANGLMLLILLHFMKPASRYLQIFRAIVIMLINIPIAIFFAWLSIQIADLQHINI